MRSPAPFTPRYHPFYCEENAWWLCQEAGLQDQDPHVVFISNPGLECLFWHQRAAAPGAPIVWDYHVVVLTKAAGGLIWDLDSRLGWPVAAGDYLRKTFESSLATIMQPKALLPVFRVIPAKRFVEVFTTDRSHMRQREGRWMQPPPDWPAPQAEGQRMNLMRFVDMVRPFEGERLTQAAMLERYGA